MASKSAHLLVISVIFLITLGIVMLSSTSVFSGGRAGDMYYDVKRQLMWLGLGVGACFAFAALDYRRLESWRWIIYGGTIVLLVLCFVPMAGERINGASRWISLKSAGLPEIRLQPSEFAKLALLLVLAGWYAKWSELSGTFWRGFAVPLLIVALPVALVGLEVDLGSAALMCAMSIGVMYVAGAGLRYVAALGLLGLAALGAAVVAIPNRTERILAFLDLEQHAQSFGHQQLQGLIALGSGGLDGLGLGSGRQKMLYLPFAHTDFIFPMVGEELGLIATLAVVFFFVAILIAGSVIALHAPDRFGRLLGFGVVMMISLQAALNIGVTTAVLPNKGLPLPFVSYGGSNLLALLAGVGILLNIYRQGTHLRDDRRFPKILRAKLTPRL